MKQRRIEISNRPDRPWEHQVLINGNDLGKVARVEVELRESHLPRVVIELSITSVDMVDLGSVEPQVILNLTKAHRQALLAIGWTPPEGS